ncbi:MAG: hypothetical protein ACQEQH_04835 [Bacillota bacterium]
MSNKVIFSTILIILIFSLNVSANNVKYFEVDQNEDIYLNFEDSRIRIDSWNRDYIKIETTYLVKNDYTIDQKQNIITFDKISHLNKHPKDLDQSKWAFIVNEVFFIITVPDNIPLNIKASSLNIKENCKLRTIDSEFTRVRGSVFLDGFEGNGKKIMIRENIYNGSYRLNYEKVIKENYRGFWWKAKNIIF